MSNEEFVLNDLENSLYTSSWVIRYFVLKWRNCEGDNAFWPLFHEDILKETVSNMQCTIFSFERIAIILLLLLLSL